ncbi:hypothetical protein ACA910_007358 [Epithemia clementina (nom. ined.)]
MLLNILFARTNPTTSLDNGARGSFPDNLGRSGYSDDTRNHLIVQGFSNTEEFQAFPINKVPNMLKTIAKAAPAGVTLPYMANLRLHGFRHWLEYRASCGEDLDAGIWMTPVMAKWTKHVTDLANATKADSKDAPKPPEPLKSISDWESHNKLWLAYLATHCNPTTVVPLTYVKREESEVDADALAATYNSIDEDLMATAAHKGEQFKLDCKQVFELYRPIIIDGPPCTFVKPTEQLSKNGREAYFVVKKQSTGQAANTIRKKQAYAKITTAKYTGRGRFPLQQYILCHQQVQNTLLELDEAVAETKKVTDFLNGITNPSLTPAKLVVNGDEGKLSDF